MSVCNKFVLRSPISTLLLKQLGQSQPSIATAAGGGGAVKVLVQSQSQSQSQSYSSVPHRSFRGLFGGKGVQFGNKISEDGGNKSRRKWRPNVVKKNLYSEALGESFKLSITTHVLRCIKKHGSFDQYLLRTTDKNLASPLGSELKRRVRAALEAKQVLEQIQQDPQQQQ